MPNDVAKPLGIGSDPTLVPRGGTAPGDPHEAARTSELFPRGTSLGRYLLIEPLGAGGLGMVYCAYDPELDRKVAIKVIRAAATEHEAEERLSARLRREAKALAKVRHPNVVAVFDIGVDAGRVYIAMELVDGVTLRRWCKQQHRTWPEIRDAFTQAAAGLSAAHRSGLVHRDFKPANVIVTPTGEVRVLDFGLARALAGDDDEQPRARTERTGPLDENVTGTGLQIGTPAYMAPEQHLGQTVGPRSDQFAFGVSLFEALYGRRPFAGSSSLDMLAQVQAGDLGPVDESVAPAFVLRAIARSLSASPSDRFASMDEFAAALAPARRRSGTALAGVFGLGLVLAGAGVFVARREAVEAPVPDEVSTLARQARDAAARAAFVYPPARDPQADTAFIKVIELERMATDPAVEVATTLRGEFSDTLLGQADALWEREGGRIFAAELYAQATMFRADERAAARSMLTPAQLSALVSSAGDRGFSAAQLAAAEYVRVLIDPSEPDRAESVARLERQGALAPTTHAALRGLVGLASPTHETDPVADGHVEVPPAAPHEAGVEEGAGLEGPNAPSEPGPDPGPAGSEGGPSVSERGSRDRSRRIASGPGPTEVAQIPTHTDTPPAPEAGLPDLPEATRDPIAASELARAGTQKLSGGQLAEAETFFHRALKADPRNTAAHFGLAKIAFERGRHVDAARHASHAVRLAPSNAAYRMLLGNAYYRLYRYEDAREQFEKARDLGDARAVRSLAKIRERLGE